MSAEQSPETSGYYGESYDSPEVVDIEIRAAFAIGLRFRGEIIDSEVDAAQKLLDDAVETHQSFERIAGLTRNLRYFQNERLLINHIYDNSHQRTDTE